MLPLVCNGVVASQSFSEVCLLPFSSGPNWSAVVDCGLLVISNFPWSIWQFCVLCRRFDHTSLSPFWLYSPYPVAVWDCRRFGLSPFWPGTLVARSSKCTRLSRALGRPTIMHTALIQTYVSNYSIHFVPIIPFMSRDAMLARYMLSSCVCLSDSGIVSKRLNIGLRKIALHDSWGTLVFWCQISRNSNWITPYGGDKCKWGGLKSATFDEKRTITRERYKIDA